jgi:hypothetical protein
MRVAFELDAAATAALHSMIASLTPHLRRDPAVANPV